MALKIIPAKICFFFVVLSSTVNVVAQENPFFNYRWTTVEASGKATERHESVFVEFQDKFYLIGGRGINPVNVYDPKSNTWETKNKSPFEIHHFQATVYGDAIYLAGAMTGKYPLETPLENIWIYYPLKDQWTKGAEIPKEIRRGGAGSVIYDDKLYLICGIELGHTSGTVNYFDSYDLKSGKWESLTKAPNIRDHFSAIVVEDKLYCIGGRNTSFHHKDNFAAFFGATMPWVDVYDFKEKKWSTLKHQVPFPTAAGGIVNIGDYILYMGGEGAQMQAYNQTQCLDISTGRWMQLAPLNIGRHGSSAVLYNNEIYFAAGSPNRGGGNMNSIEKFSKDHSWETLFDGSTLNGWEVKCVEKDKSKQFWTVGQGSIICSSMGSTDHNYIWLQSKREFGDFEFRLKFQASRDQKGNSGVQVRSRYDENAEVEKGVVGWLDGPQIDIEPNNPWRNGFIYDETRDTKRWINPSLPNWEISKEKYAPKKFIHYFDDEVPEWNDMTIICNGNHIKTIVNNVVVSDYDGTGVLDDESHEKYRVGLNGHIALQLHKNSENLMRFKDIEIRVIE